MPPKDVGPRPGHHSWTEDTDTTTSNHHEADSADSTAYVRQLRARRAASRRIVGGDPWCYTPTVNGYSLAARHLLELGLTPAPNVPAMHDMWRAGGQSRDDARSIAERWQAAS